MTNLYIVSPKAFAGKTLFAVTLARCAEALGKSVRYFKPLGPYPVEVDGVTTDRDAAYVNSVLAEKTPINLLCPVPITPELSWDTLTQTPTHLIDDVTRAYQQIASSCDLVVSGGSGSLFCSGVTLGLSNPAIADATDAKVLVVSRYKPDRTHDELLTASRLFNGRMVGAVINSVAPEHLPYVTNTLAPFMERHGIPIFGILPDEPLLRAISARDLVKGLDANVLCGENYLDVLIERFVVGAMNAEHALRHFRAISNKAVITGGDRPEILLTALETSAKAIILTGGREPRPIVISSACEYKLPILAVREDTITTVDRIKELQDTSRFRQQQKIECAEQLVRNHVALDRLWAAVFNAVPVHA